MMHTNPLRTIQQVFDTILKKIYRLKKIEISCCGKSSQGIWLCPANKVMPKKLGASLHGIH